jgi:hypothetical protein
MNPSNSFSKISYYLLSQKYIFLSIIEFQNPPKMIFFRYQSPPTLVNQISGIDYQSSWLGKAEQIA